MARPLRIEFPGAVYHVTARGNERKPIYRGDSDRLRFLTTLADVIEQFHLLLHAYVLMDNHVLCAAPACFSRKRCRSSNRSRCRSRRVMTGSHSAAANVLTIRTTGSVRPPASGTS